MTETTQMTLPGFKRRARIGFNIIGFSQKGETRFLKVLELGTFTKKDGDVLEYAEVLDLETGEEGRMWLDGALKYNFSKMKMPFSAEIRYDGKKPADIEIDGKLKSTEINTYSMWELSEEETETLS